MLGPKRQRRGSMSKRNQGLEKSLECKEDEEDEAEEQPLLSSPESDLRDCYIKNNGAKATDDIEPEEQMMVKKLLENAENVQEIVSENAECATSDEKNDKDQTNLIRRQGSKLIRCLGDFLNTINDLRDLLEDCE